MALAVRRSVSDARETLLDVRGVSVRYGQLRALENIDLDIPKGQLIALAGENGAGKSTLVRCIAGDLAASSGEIVMTGKRLGSDPRAVLRQGVAVVWQDLALCDNLDVAANVLLGRERRGVMESESRAHATAAALLERLRIPIADTTQEVRMLSGGQRQLVAVARAMRDRPELLILDEPTASLGGAESAQVERLTTELRRQGTTILLVSHDIDQIFRLAERVVVLRQGRLVADIDPASSHPEEVLSLISGQPFDTSARHQLNRLRGLSGRLASADPSSSVPLILSALAAALGADQLCLHQRECDRLRMVASLGLPAVLARSWADLPLGPSGGPVGAVAASGRLFVEPDVHTGGSWKQPELTVFPPWVHSTWSVPFRGSGGVTGVVTVLRDTLGRPLPDEVDLVNLYAGYAASALERDQLLGQLTARNRVLETIREILETLAGPVPLTEGLAVALEALRGGLEADDVSLLTQRAGEPVEHRARVSRPGYEAPPAYAVPERPRPAPAEAWLAGAGDDGRAHQHGSQATGWQLAVRFPTPGGWGALLAHWPSGGAPPDGQALIEDASRSLGLALQREESERARRETLTLRRSQDLQRQFLSRLSHELRTPLTAIRGYASSLMQPDVTWDRDSQDRFLTRIGAESARLGRLVDDLLDFSAIESGILRLHPDWCDLGLVLDAARGCLPPMGRDHVEVRCPPGLPAVWGDHDRLEQVFVNLLDNAFRHNPGGTKVTVCASTDDDSGVLVSVSDDGQGVPPGLVLGAASSPGARRSSTAGAGLGLTIARGIVEAHGGIMVLDRLSRGTRFSIRLPVEQDRDSESPDRGRESPDRG